MLRKVLISETNVFDSETGQFIGYVCHQSPEMADIMLHDGTHIIAYYGTIDDYNQFYTICMNFHQCGINCIGIGLPPGIACYYNSIAISRAGYYVNV